MPKRPKHREQIVADARKQLAEIEQYFLDAEHWNRTRGVKEGLIDPDPDGDVAAMRDGLKAMLAAEDARPLPPILPARFARPTPTVQ